jgi:hypothetical protein
MAPRVAAAAILMTGPHRHGPIGDVLRDCEAMRWSGE